MNKKLIFTFSIAVGLVVLLFVGLISSIAVEPLKYSFELDPKGTYLRTHNDDPGDPLMVNLKDIEVEPGQLIKVRYSGTFRYGQLEKFDWRMPWRYVVIGLFSSSSVILPEDSEHRVPGAIATCQPPFITNLTYHDKLPTDIPQDFRIAPHRGFKVIVPKDAEYLFLSIHDIKYSDNQGNNIKLSIGVCEQYIKWFPPITNNQPINKNQTLPIKFEYLDCDNDPIKSGVYMLIKGPGWEDGIRLDPEYDNKKYYYHVNFKAKDYNLKSGTYTANVYNSVSEKIVGSYLFTVIE